VFVNRARAFRLLLAGAAVFASSCARREQTTVQRLAVLRFENLTPDASTDWIGRALPEVIVSELAGAPGIYAIPSARLHAQAAAFGVRPAGAPGVSAEAQLAQSLGANRIGYGEYSIVGGRLRVRLTVEDPARRQIAEGPIEVAVNAGDAIGAASAIARRISPNARPYATSNAEALAAYVRGLETPDPAAMRRYGEEAVARDPNYGPAYLLLVDTALKQQDRAAAVATLQAAAAKGAAIQEESRRRLEVVSATLRGDADGLERALSGLAQSAPLDASLWRSLAEAESSRRRYPQAVAAYQRALSIEPEEATGWNELGYVAAYAENSDLALNALRRYQSLRPSDPNPLDSMGDVNVIFGHLKEAEALYLEAHQKNPAFLNGMTLFKAAAARLMTGDVAGANTILGDGAASADWLWLTGRRKQAFDRLSADAAGANNREIQARAYAQLAVWALQLNDRAAGSRLAAQGAALATPATAGALALSRLVTMPSAPAGEWAKRAEQAFPGAPQNVRDLALAYALLLDHRLAEAAPLLRSLEARTGPNGDRSLAVDLAWALIETGKVEEAAPLLRFYPVLTADNARPYVGLYFPRFFQLRAIVAERTGKADEARENRRIYAALGGD
jgi:Flp pilus assembly protein TadD